MISVIIPVYNTEKYLHRCLASIMNQTFSDLEIIVVDDGSTDASASIIDEIAKTDKRIKVLHVQNGGQSAARNRGLDVAKGEIVSFVDSDDYLPINAYEIMCDCMIHNNAEIVCGGINEVFENGQPSMMLKASHQTFVFNHEETVNELCLQKRFRFQVWNKLIKKELINNIRFPENQKYEEIRFEREIIRKCSCSAYIDEPVYNYVISRPGNTKSSFTKQKLAVFKDIDEFIEEVKEDRIIDALKQLVAMRLTFSVSLGIEARRRRADKDTIEYLDKQFALSKALCVENNCGNKRLYQLYSLSPWLVDNYRRFHANMMRVENRIISVIHK